MTPHEKAVSAINLRLERLQADLRQAKAESAQRYIVQSLVVTIGAAEALNDYVRMVGRYAERRHADVKQANDALAAQHAGLLNAGKELLERLKANPADRSIRKEIERVQQGMASIQKAVRRDANALQRDLAPGLAMIDEAAAIVRRLAEADDIDALKRLIKAVVEQTRGLYATHPALPGRNFVDAPAWEESAIAELEQALGFYDAYARAGSEVILALEAMTIAVSDQPPPTSEEAMQRANEAMAARLKEITARY